MEELFFAALIGTVHIDSVIPYILRMDQTEYNGQFGNITIASQPFRPDFIIIFLFDVYQNRWCHVESARSAVVFPYPYRKP